MNVVHFVESGWAYGPTTAALATVTTTPERCVSDVDIELNAQDFTWSNTEPTAMPRANVFAFVLQGVGNFYGLGRSDVAEAVMHQSNFGGLMALHPDDVAGICALYPASPFTDAGPAADVDAGGAGSDAGPGSGFDAGPGSGFDAGPGSGFDAGPRRASEPGCRAAPGGASPVSALLLGLGVVVLGLRRRRVS